MKTFIIIFTIWCAYAAVVVADYRFKRRGSSPQQRPSPLPGPPPYLKKWQLSQSRPNRPPRPIPVHIQPQNYGAIPHGIGPVKPNYQSNIKRLPNQIPVKNIYRKTTIKPFQSPRPLNFKHEFDYHIQTNNIPNPIPIQNKVVDLSNAIPIKQLDEKGPIHTIPAPNLSRDKPRKPEESNKERRHSRPESYRPDFNHYGQQKFHQYQVTESSEHIPKYSQPQRQNIEPSQSLNQYRNQLQQNQYLQGSSHLVASNSYENIPVEHTLSLGTTNFQGFGNDFNQQPRAPAHSKDSQQLSASYQTQDQSGANSRPSGEFQQEYQPQKPPQSNQAQAHLQLNIPDYQTMLKQAQQFQNEPAYLSQIQQAIGQNSNEKSKPQSQSFSYNDQFFQNIQHDGSSSIKFPELEANQGNQDNQGNQNLNVQQQNSYIQRLINSDNEEQNQNKRSDGPNVFISNREDSNTEQLSNFYMTLPNREAAEALASLQEAGKVNSNLMQMKNQDIQSLHLRPKNPLTIYVSDEHSSDKDDQLNNLNSSDGNNQVDEFAEQDYEENGDEIADSQNFGNKIKPKKSK